MQGKTKADQAYKCNARANVLAFDICREYEKSSTLWTAKVSKKLSAENIEEIGFRT